MTKRLRIEDQIEKSRNLGNWESLREEGRLLSERVGNKDGAVILLQCECDFERQLQKSKAPSYDIISTLEQIPFSRDSKFNLVKPNLEAAAQTNKLIELFTKLSFKKTDSLWTTLEKPIS